MNKILHGISKVGIFRIIRTESPITPGVYKLAEPRIVTTVASKQFFTKDGVLYLFKYRGRLRDHPPQYADYFVIKESETDMYIRFNGITNNVTYHCHLL